MFSKAWKLYCPSISKKKPSVYWDWSNEQDGVRIFEVFCADLTGHTSYIILRITRNTEEECIDEFEGQLTDGYFEDYRGDVKGIDFDPKKVKLNMSLVADMCTEVRTRNPPDIRWEVATEHKFIRRDLEDTTSIILTYFGMQCIRDNLETVRSEYEAARRKTYDLKGEDTPANRKTLTAAEDKYIKALAEAWAAIRQFIVNEQKNGGKTA